MKKILFATPLLLFLAACSKHNSGPEEEKKPSASDFYFNVVYSTSTTGNTATYAQALTDLKEGEISFKGRGFEIPSTRTARIYASEDGQFLYNLNYGGGRITKYKVWGGEEYEELVQINVTPVVGTEYPRWTKLNDEEAELHNVKASPVYKEGDGSPGGYQYTESEATLVHISLQDLTPGAAEKFIVPTSSTDDENKFYVSSLDAAVIAGDKAYYGVAKSKANPNKPDENLKGIAYPATALVVDFPSLKNPRVVESAVAEGSTAGYRIPVAHRDEHGDVYQLCPTHMLKLKDGKYDDSYEFDLSAAAGAPIRALGWFYAGNGIGYATCYDAEKGDSEAAAAWGIVRLDLYRKTAVRMNTPEKLYLFQYQYAKVRDGKVYFALCPVGGEGNVYIFDSEKEDAGGFEVGAKLQAGAGASYIGIF